MRLRHAADVPFGLPVQRLVDPDVPLKLSAGYSVTDPPLYWRLLDPRFSLVELGVDRRDGRFTSLTVTLYNGELHPLGAAGGPPPAETRAVLPAFGLEPWGGPRPDLGVDGLREEFHDVPGRCRLELGGGTLRVVLFPEPVVRRVPTRGEVIFELNAADELCAVSVLSLGPGEMEMLSGKVVFPT